MRLLWRNFKGIMPRRSRAGLPDGYGQQAENVRARSGDLESWFKTALDRVLPKGGLILSIFLMDRQFWLHWNEEVETARGPIPVESGDQERTYITGLDCPRVTNLKLATIPDVLGQAALLGWMNAGNNLNGFTVLDSTEDSNTYSVTVDGTEGEPPASFNLQSSSGTTAVVAHKPLSSSEPTHRIVQVGFKLVDGVAELVFEADINGLGTSVRVEQRTAGLFVTVHSKPDWRSFGTLLATSVSSSVSVVGDWYTLEVTASPDGDARIPVGFRIIDHNNDDTVLMAETAIVRIDQIRRYAGLSVFSGQAFFDDGVQSSVVGNGAFDTQEYPYRTLKLGVSSPDIAPTTSVSLVGGNLEVTYFGNGTSTGGWDVNETSPDDSDFTSEADAGLPADGTPTDGFKLSADNARITASRPHEGAPLSDAGQVVIEADVRVVSGGQGFSLFVIYDADTSGVGRALEFRYTDQPGDPFRALMYTTVIDGFNADEDRESNHHQINAFAASGLDLSDERFARVKIVRTLAGGIWTVVLTVGYGDESTDASAFEGREFGFSGQIDKYNADDGQTAETAPDQTVFGDLTDFGFRLDSPNASDAFLDNVTVRTAGGGADLDGITFYVYTRLNELFEESAPSPVSEQVLVSPSLSREVQITDPQPSSGDYLSYGYRLYRTATGASATAFLLVTEVLYAAPESPLPNELSYSDRSDDSDLSEPLPSAIWDTPPVDGRNIVSLPNGVMVMSSGNQVVPSVRFRPHAYPVNFRLATDYRIVALAALDTTVIVMTESHVYQVIGDDPSQLTMAKYEAPYACVSRRSVASLYGFGVVFASPDGLVAVNTQGLRLISEPWITAREWRRDFNPETIIAAAHDDIYFGFYEDPQTAERKSFVFDPAQDGFGFATLDIPATGLHVDALTDTLYLVDGDTLYRWEGSPDRMNYKWRSRKELLPVPAAFSIAQVDADSYDNLTFRYLGDGVERFSTAVTGPGEFRVPCGTYRDIEVCIEGSDVVHHAQLAESVEELV